MTTNVPQDVIELAKQAGLLEAIDDCWLERGDYDKPLAKFAELLRAQRQQGAEPVAWLVKFSDRTKLVSFTKEQTDYLAMHGSAQVTPLYTTPPQANALVATAYRKAAETCESVASERGSGEAYGAAKVCAEEILAAIPADAEAALREVCMKVARTVADEDDYIEPELQEIVNSVLGESGK
jgi:hypothetical protein